MRASLFGTLAGGGAAPWTPADIPGLTYWFKADAIVGLSDGDPVSTWVDSSGGGNNATQGTGSAQPTYKTNQINTSLPCVRFDGGDYLSSGASAATKPCTNFAVVKITDVSTYRTIVGADTTGGSQLRIDQTSGVQHFLKEGAADIGASSTGITPATWQYLAMTYSNTGGYAFFLDTVADGTGTADVTFVASLLTIGVNASFGLAEYWLGDIAELGEYDSVLSPTDLTLLAGYVTAKYGI